MVYTVTLNPAIDCAMWLDGFEKGETNRCNSEFISVGGKGLNVSFVLKELGVESVATGFVAGFTGEAVESALENNGIKTDFVRLSEGNTRINVKLKEESETEINGTGPFVDEKSKQELVSKLAFLKKGDVLVLAGSLPRGISECFYGQILEKVGDRGVLTVVDTSGKALENVLEFNPFLIKPNLGELEEITGEKLGTIEEIYCAAEKLKKMGTVNVLVSMGEKGAVLVDKNGKRYYSGAAKIKCVNSVGAGDSMVAGFIAGYLQTDDFEYSLKLGNAAGAATAFSKGLAKADDIKKLFDIRG